MIKAMHQFSTIQTTYSEDQKSFVSQVNPKRAMLVQVDFEVFGEVSGLSVYLLFALLSLLSLLGPFHCSRQYVFLIVVRVALNCSKQIFLMESQFFSVTQNDTAFRSYL